MTDEEILWKYIDLTESTLDEEGKAELMEIILKYKKAFSLRDEIGECPNIKVDIDVIDDTPFFVRPFPISEEDKPIMDWQMQRLVSLGILSRNTTSHTSPFRKSPVQNLIMCRFERCFSQPETHRKSKRFLWDSALLWRSPL